MRDNLFPGEISKDTLKLGPRERFVELRRALSGPKVALLLLAAVHLLPPAFARPAQSMDEMLGRQFLRDPSEQRAFLKENMARAQKAAETYASHHKGVYPTKLDDAFKSYFPLGNCDGKNYSMWTIPHNPYSQKPEWPTLGKLPSARAASAGRLRPGEVEYSPVGNGKGYLVRAGGPDGSPVKDKNGKVTVLQESKIEFLKANARTVQWACEHYAEQNHNMFPKEIDDDFKYCFPFGDRKNNKVGFMLLNPFTGKLEWPILGGITSVQKARAQKPSVLLPGAVEYSCIPGRKNYAIRLGDDRGRALVGITGGNSTFVLARDGDGSGHEKKF